MAPRKPTMEEQQDEFRQTLENFTVGLQEAFQAAVTNALTTVLEQQHALRAVNREPRQQQQVFHEDSDEDNNVDNIFSNPAQGQNRDARQAGGGRNMQDNRQAMGRVNPPQRWESGFRLEIPDSTG